MKRALTLITTGLLLSTGLAVVTGGGTAAAASCTRHVATTGSDSASGSSSAPWATLGHALTSLRAGDVLCVHGGDYAAPQVTLPPGTATAPVTVAPAGDGRVLVRGETSLRDPDHWVIRGLEWTNPGGAKAIVTITAGTGWTFEGNHLFDGGYAGLLVGKSTTYGNPHHYTIRDNVIHGTTASNVYHNPGRDSRGGLIERNLLFDAGTNNLKLGWGGTDVCSGTNYENFGIGEVTVRYNTLHHADQPLVVAESGGDLPVLVHRNLVSGGTRTFAVRVDNVEGCLRENVSITDNLAHGGSTFIEDFADAPAIISKAVGNVWPRDPRYDSTSGPNGFRPLDSVAQGYGRYAATGTAEPVLDTTAPSVPQSLTAVEGAPGAVTVAWTASSDAVGVKGYRVWRDGSLRGDVTTTSLVDSGLAAGTRYSYTVAAYDEAGNLSAASAPAVVTTAAPVGSVRTFMTTDDTYVAKAKPTSRYGSRAVLTADGSPKLDVLLRFAPDLTGCLSPRAALVLTVGEGSISAGSVFAAAATAWSQSTVNWNTAPAVTGSALATLGKVSAGPVVEVPLSVAPQGVVTYRMTSTSTDGVDLASAEAGTAKAPRLRVVCG